MSGQKVGIGIGQRSVHDVAATAAAASAQMDGPSWTQAQPSPSVRDSLSASSVSTDETTDADEEDVVKRVNPLASLRHAANHDHGARRSRALTSQTAAHVQSLLMQSGWSLDALRRYRSKRDQFFNAGRDDDGGGGCSKTYRAFTTAHSTPSKRPRPFEDVSDAIDSGILGILDAQRLFRIFFDHFNSQTTVLDPDLHTFAYVRQTSKPLFHVVLAIAATFHDESTGLQTPASTAALLSASAEEPIWKALRENRLDVEAIQTLLLLFLFPLQSADSHPENAWM